MAAKEIVFSTQARAEIARGLNVLANAVKVTLGPRGRNVVIEKSWGSPTVTKDGVTVAKEIELEGSKLVAAGANPMDIKRGIEEGVAAIVEHLKGQSKPTKGKTEIAQVD